MSASDWPRRRTLTLIGSRCADERVGCAGGREVGVHAPRGYRLAGREPLLHRLLQPGRRVH
eukprot:2216614-Pyramimonas_sp.AAC.2